MNSQATLQEILTYSPKPLRFGTSGVRAKVEELTDIEVYCLTRGTLAYFDKIGKLCNRVSAHSEIAIPLAGDLRPSTGRLLEATAKAIIDFGCQVDYVGRIPTPALAFYALQNGVASLVVTGSHIPADRNGQKANRCDGEVLKSDEAGIIAAVETVRTQEYGRPASLSPFDANGRLKAEYRVALSAVNPAAQNAYRKRYCKVFPRDGLAGIRLMFFEYSAVGREILPEILEAAGAEVIRAGRSEDFIPLDTEAISDQHLNMLAELAGQHGGKLDAIVTTDGDSDRPLVIGVDSCREGLTLRFIPGDLLGALVADALQADAVAVPISANPALEEYFARRNVLVRRTRIGSPYVIEAMATLKSQGHKRIVSWEANGGFLLGSQVDFEEGVLETLPTRDAALPILTVLRRAKRENIRVGKLLDAFPPCYGKSDLLDNFPQEHSKRILDYFNPGDDSIKELRFLAGGIDLVDGEGRTLGHWTEDSPPGRLWLEKKELLQRVFTAAGGFSEIVRINLLDGIRCYFSNGEIAHVRPSGNAPQLRIYAFAATPERAGEIAAMAIREEDGLLRRLQGAVLGQASGLA